MVEMTTIDDGRDIETCHLVYPSHSMPMYKDIFEKWYPEGVPNMVFIEDLAKRQGIKVPESPAERIARGAFDE